MDHHAIQTAIFRFGLLFAAGGLGAMSRYVFSAWLNSCAWCGKPWGILACNLFGCFLFGFLTVLLTRGFSVETKLIVLTGFLGAFTTFSTFAFDTVDLIQQSRYATACFNLLFHNVFGILMVVGGLMTGKWLMQFVQ